MGAALTAAAAAGAARADALDEPGQEVERLRSYSLEDLANLTVTSVQKRPEPLSATPASIYVITADDIARAGATSLPEALRLAPNLQVARINAYSYAITARGMNSAESANKLLVLVNGRSVYEPIGSGVLWQQVDVVMSNIARIEVVSGPGGTLWGANAVNGVINVITKGADQTHGFSAQAGGGDLDKYIDATYGARLGSGDIRLSAEGFRREGLDKRPGDPTHDAFNGWLANLRYSAGDAKLSYTLIFNLYDNQVDHGGGNFWGGHVLGRAAAELAGGSHVDVQAYASRDDRSDANTHERRDTFNIQAQQAFSLGRNQVVWGGEVRSWREYFLSTNAFHFADPRTTITLASLFVQDEVALRPDLKLTAGLKLEGNSYSGADWMPNVRLAWTPTPTALAWAAISRAVRTPNRIERELEATGFLRPAPDFGAEEMWSYEAGYRAQPFTSLSLSVTAYYDRYDKLRTDEFTGGNRLPLFLGNGAEGAIYGVEAWGTLELAPWWRLKGGFDSLHRDIRLKSGHTDLSQLQVAGFDPNYQAQLRSQMDLGPNVDLDIAVRRVGLARWLNLPASAPAYTEADARLAWKVTDRLELSVAGFNLLHDRHLEIDDTSTAPLRFVPRSIYAGLRWGF